ncbi:4-hydroxythreonine-4-phosphate dehydrogenase PdxA [Roseomonas gilardii subsp. gilardii]|uniref:4-hydroxythreonine-4-phosphate dehydrogenase PdxA n=1 Tax=Roseomonas gilardii TaxID=257708 RepID=UPI001FF7E820|nr:4-hydroxythreonine-4-phosphate dehydrogenase PdxA [Roseomonas gilardii]UPG73450.1 4-hydroxythreonine-4-phosphate dehydrogenase PdxA [Roseomonas gilardii subsp. gilardii]
MEAQLLTRPRIALAMGDAAGVSSELAAKVLADPVVREAAEITVIGDVRMLARGAEFAGVDPDVDVVREGEAMPRRVPGRPVLVDLGHGNPDDIKLGEISEAGGRFATENFRRALRMAAAGEADAVCFTPFNKAAMRLVTPGYEDEIGFSAETIGFHGVAKEFNVLEGLWNARVTSHVPLKDVAGLLTKENILDNLRLTDEALRASGVARPRIAVAGLNPHAGDNGNFGREEIEVIAPAVEAGKREQIACDGPFPADTVFVRAKRGDFDAVLTMYHDQGQIAMKLIGFDAGVTLMGGFPFPICTAAHGTAYDIAGKGIAHPGAMRNALLLASRMAASRIAA